MYRYSADSVRNHPNVRPQGDAPAPAEVMRRCGFKLGDDGRWWGTLPAFEALLREVNNRRNDDLPRPVEPELAPVSFAFLATQAALEDLAAKIYRGHESDG